MVDLLGWFGMSYEQAVDYYTDVFRRNFEFFILIVALLCFFPAPALLLELVYEVFPGN